MQIFGFLDSHLPIYYTTFMQLRRRIMVVYKWASPLSRPFKPILDQHLVWSRDLWIGDSWCPVFKFSDPDSPIHYTTFIGLRWRLRVVYTWASPFKAFLSLSKIGPDFLRKMCSLYIISFSRPLKGNPCAKRGHLTDSKNRRRGLDCTGWLKIKYPTRQYAISRQ